MPTNIFYNIIWFLNCNFVQFVRQIRIRTSKLDPPKVLWSFRIRLKRLWSDRIRQKTVIIRPYPAKNGYYPTGSGKKRLLSDLIRQKTVIIRPDPVKNGYYPTGSLAVFYGTGKTWMSTTHWEGILYNCL